MTVGLIQARMGSTRLPGKVLKTIGGRSQLGQLIHRISPANLLDKVMVVTSDLPQDDVLADHCRENGISVFRGSEWDVLDRFYQAALSAGLQEGDTLVRITADCPLHHHDVIDFSLRIYFEHKLDYFSNSFAPLYEDGCDTEVFGFSALRKAWSEASLLSQREHVTPFIKDSGRFLCGYKKFSAGYSYKLSVDDPADFELVSTIFDRLGSKDRFGIPEVVDLLSGEPDLLKINSQSVINAGYAKSLREDKNVK